MLCLNLPELDENVKPAFADSTACAHWVSQFQLTDIRQAHRTVSRKLWELNHAVLPALNRLKITEQLRDTVSIVQSGFARKIFGKPLPLDEAEFTVLEDVISLWAAMSASYGHCLNASLEGDPAVARHLALISQRCLRYTGLQIVEYLLMQHQVDHRLWLEFHQLYQFSEEKGFASFPVLESLKLYPPPASCADHFIRTVLICQADPYELPRKQFRLVNRWLDEWVSLVTVDPKPPANAKETPPLVIDLESAGCIQHPAPAPAGPTIRYFDVSDLSKHLRIKAALLEQGQMPAQLGLGEDLSPASCLALIEKLHRHWCEGEAVRSFERRSISHLAEICFGLPDIHHHLSGKVFAQPGQESRLNLKQHEEISLFGHVVSRTEQSVSPEVENWDIQNEHSKGFSLIRDKTEHGHRVSLGHLVGVRPAGEEGFTPCVIRWVIAGLDGSVNMGLRLLEGRPETVAIRPTGINLTASGKYVQAILLHNGEGSSLIMPKGWYAPGRIVEVRDKDNISMELKLVDLAGKGADYERAMFTQL